MSEQTLYKAFKAGRIGPYSGKKWPKRLGTWVTVEDDLVLCRNGIHVARGESELLSWLHAEVYVVEARGECIESNDKAAYKSVRLVRRVESLNDRTLRLFAADCAERALLRLDSSDLRSVEAVRVARLFARGEAKRAAWAAARDAAAAAAWAAAWDAAAAAWDAAAAARDAARAAEREWQAQRLRAYINGDGLEADSE